MLKLIEYIKLHIISLTQDLVQVEDKMQEEMDLNSDDYNQLDIEAISINGQILAARHILSVANDIINDLLTGE